jgi:hypothetical protein
MDIPRKPFVCFIWGLATILWVAHPFIMMKYFVVTQRLRWYPTQADSIGIPIIGGFFLAIVGYPLFFIFCRKATRNIAESYSFFSWDVDRPIRSLMISLIFIALAGLSVQSVFHSYRLLDEIRNSDFFAMQDAAIYRVAFSFGWVVFWLVMRGCFMTQNQKAEQATSSNH